MRLPAISTALALVALLATAAAHPGGGSAAAARTSATPRPPLLDVATPRLGKLRLGQPASAYMNALGTPADVQWLPPPAGPIMSWYSKVGRRTAVTFTDATQTTASSIYADGPLRTGKGDRIGTPLATFLRHWPNAKKADTWWSRSYHVANVWFHFNTKNRLYAVELGDRSITLLHQPKK